MRSRLTPIKQIRTADLQKIAGVYHPLTVNPELQGSADLRI
jgi:hypothetical protein